MIAETVRVEPTLGGDDDDAPLSLHASLFLDRTGPCDGVQITNAAELRRMRAHRAAWRRLVAEGRPLSCVVCIHEDEPGAPMPAHAQWWLRTGHCDVFIPRWSVGGRAYAIRFSILPRLLRLTEPIEMNLAAVWVIVDDLHLLRVVWDDGILPTIGDDMWSTPLTRNAKVFLPNVSPAGALTVCVVVVLVVIYVLFQ